MIVASLTRLSNIVVANNAAFPFDHARVMHPGYCSWAGEGNPVVILRRGWYNMAGIFTTLGTTPYGGPSNDDWIAAITRNGLALADFVVAGRHNPSNGAGADLMPTISDDVWCEVSDEIDVIFQNQSASTILVESNPSDGSPSGYLTDAGPGTLSPHLVIKAVAGAEPV